MAEENYKSLDDIVFENRNQEYGAYQIRKKQPSILLKSFLIGVGFILFSTLAIVLYNTVFTKADKEDTVVDVTLTDVDVPDIPEEEEKPEEPEPEPEPEIAEVRVVVPEPKKDVVKEEPMASIDEMKDKVIGTENKEGEASSGVKGKSEPTSSGDGDKPVAKPEPAKNFTAREVKDMAIYPGCEKLKGEKDKLQACMQKELQKELNDQLSDFAETMNDSGESRAVARVQFIVDKSGKITQIKAVEAGGSNINKKLATEAEKAMQRISSRLTARGKTIEPAKLEDGSSVNLVFVLPVTFQLQ